MDKITIELSTEQYKNMHLLLHNLVELSSSLSTQHPVFKDMNESLKTIKTTLATRTVK